MKTSDYIVEYLIAKGITDVFGYPGVMVTHLMDSFSKYQNQIKAHVTYNEQGAAMAACGYAQISGKTGVAYATSGPGATNLITGICNAYMDSIPILFITGQINSFEQKGFFKVRQRGFQETDIVSMVKPITKYAIQETLIMSAIDKMKRNEPIEMTPCTQLWDYLNVEDASRAMKIFALIDCQNGIYNIASGDYKPLKEFVEEIKSALNSSSEPRFGAIPYGTNGPINLTPDVKKIKNALVWEPKIKFIKDVRKMPLFTESGGGNALIIDYVVHQNEWRCAA